MLFDAEQRRLPILDSVALGAFALLGTAFELTGVNIFVAIFAIRKRQGSFKISADVAGDARYLCMTAKQRELCF